MNDKFKEGQDVFYCNDACVFLSYIRSDKELAAIAVPAEEGDTYIIVRTEDIRTQAKTFSEEYEEHKRQLEKEKAEARAETQNELYKMQKEMEDIRKKISQYKGLESFLDVLDGKSEWAVIMDYDSVVIKPFNDLRCSYDKNNFAAVIYRHDMERNEVGMIVSEYSYCPGHSNKRCQVFKTLDEAKAFATELLNKMLCQPSWSSFDTIEKYGLTPIHLEEWNKERKAYAVENAQKEYTRYLSEFNAAKAKLLKLKPDMEIS